MGFVRFVYSRMASLCRTEHCVHISCLKNFAYWLRDRDCILVIVHRTKRAYVNRQKRRPVSLPAVRRQNRVFTAVKLVKGGARPWRRSKVITTVAQFYLLQQMFCAVECFPYLADSFQFLVYPV